MRFPFFRRGAHPVLEVPIIEAERGTSFWKNIIVRFLLFFGSLPLLASFLILAIFIRPRETALVLHYNVYFGVDVLGTWWQTYILPSLCLLFFVIHVLLAFHFYKRADRVASYLLLLGAGLLALGAFIASVSIAFINY